MDDQLRALKWRAEHRGTREADMMIGGFFEAHHQNWGTQEREWFGALLDEQDVDIMAWAIGTLPVPESFQGLLMDELKRLDFIKVFK